MASNTTDEGSIGERPLTIPEFAALCRERCRIPAQGYDDNRSCGTKSQTEEGEWVFNFCGRHWGAVL